MTTRPKRKAVKASKQRKKPRVPPHVEKSIREYRRKEVSEALSKMDDGIALGQTETYRVREILRLILGGFDPRKYLGISPKKGNPPNTMINVIKAAYYLQLYDTESKEAAAAQQAADFWHVDVSNVRKNAKSNEAAARRFMRGNTPDQILCAAELAIKHWQLGDNEAH